MENFLLIVILVNLAVAKTGQINDGKYVGLKVNKPATIFSKRILESNEKSKCGEKIILTRNFEKNAERIFPKLLNLNMKMCPTRIKERVRAFLLEHLTVYINSKKKLISSSINEFIAKKFSKLDHVEFVITKPPSKGKILKSNQIIEKFHFYELDNIVYKALEPTPGLDEVELLVMNNGCPELKVVIPVYLKRFNASKTRYRCPCHSLLLRRSPSVAKFLCRRTWKKHPKYSNSPRNLQKIDIQQKMHPAPPRVLGKSPVLIILNAVKLIPKEVSKQKNHCTSISLKNLLAVDSTDGMSKVKYHVIDPPEHGQVMINGNVTYIFSQGEN